MKGLIASEPSPCLNVHSMLAQSIFKERLFSSFFLSSSVLARHSKFRDNQQVIEVKNVMIKTIEKIAWLDLGYLIHVFLQQPYMGF